MQYETFIWFIIINPHCILPLSIQQYTIMTCIIVCMSYNWFDTLVRPCSAYDHFLSGGMHLTKKLLFQGFQQSPLKATYRKYYGRWNDLVCPYNPSLSEILSDMLQENCKAVFIHWFWLCVALFTRVRLLALCGCYSS